MTENSQSVMTTSTQSTPEIKLGYPKKVKSSLFIPLPIDNEQIRRNLTYSYLIYLDLNDQMQEVILELDSETTVLKAIVSSLKYFQDKLMGIDINPDHYVLYVAKKNGQPKLDYPSFEMNQFIQRTMNKQFSLVHVINTESNGKIAYKQLPKISSFQEGANKQITKRKYTDSPQRQQKGGYQNSLADIDDFKERKNALSKEIEKQVGTKKSNWFLRLLGCGCTQNKNDF